MNIKSSSLAALSTLVMAFGLLSGPAQAEEGAATLYQEHCIKCHGSEVYTRDDRKIHSYDGLVSQVRRCELSLDLTWFDDEITSVADYLNKRFYHFKQ